jgi:hypothetical protein
MSASAARPTGTSGSCRRCRARILHDIVAFSPRAAPGCGFTGSTRTRWSLPTLVGEHAFVTPDALSAVVDGTCVDHKRAPGMQNAPFGYAFDDRLANPKRRTYRLRVLPPNELWPRSPFVVVPAGGDAELVCDDLVDKAVLVGDPT